MATGDDGGRSYAPVELDATDAAHVALIRAAAVADPEVREAERKLDAYQPSANALRCGVWFALWSDYWAAVARAGKRAREQLLKGELPRGEVLPFPAARRRESALLKSLRGLPPHPAPVGHLPAPRSALRRALHVTAWAKLGRSRFGDDRYRPGRYEPRVTRRGRLVFKLVSYLSPSWWYAVERRPPTDIRCDFIGSRHHTRVLPSDVAIFRRRLVAAGYTEERADRALRLCARLCAGGRGESAGSRGARPDAARVPDHAACTPGGDGAAGAAPDRAGRVRRSPREPPRRLLDVRERDGDRAGAARGHGAARPVHPELRAPGRVRPDEPDRGA